MKSNTKLRPRSMTRQPAIIVIVREREPSRMDAPEKRMPIALNTRVKPRTKARVRVRILKRPEPSRISARP